MTNYADGSPKSGTQTSFPMKNTCTKNPDIPAGNKKNPRHWVIKIPFNPPFDDIIEVLIQNGENLLIYNKSSSKFPTRIPIFSNRNSMEFAHK